MKKWIYLVIVQTEEIMNSIILMSLRKETEIVRGKILNFDHDDDEEED